MQKNEEMNKSEKMQRWDTGDATKTDEFSEKGGGRFQSKINPEKCVADFGPKQGFLSITRP